MAFNIREINLSIRETKCLVSGSLVGFLRAPLTGYTKRLITLAEEKAG